ncbi:hypothetical protein JJV70_22215, partial [Streptomyces sp. JJ66]|uniref:hypothetical protein n=1 Tax=Streptomyces sp. JJ66 TaxID=2803843 RepID=UPI001C567DA9
EPAERETRVEVPVRLCLTFAEMLGLLTFTTGMCVTDDDLDVNRHGEPCDVFLYEALVYALVQNDADAIEWNAERAMLAYIGHGRPSDPPVSYLRRLGAEITRVFGVAPNAAVVGVAR